MPTEIPFVPGDPEQKISISLDDQLYVLRARWNTRDDDGVGAWYLDAWQSDGVTRIASGIKLVVGIMLGRLVHHQLFLGGMFLVDYTGTGNNPGLNDLGNTVILLHMTIADQTLARLNPAGE